jgi:hypothetical protein
VVAKAADCEQPQYAYLAIANMKKHLISPSGFVYRIVEDEPQSERGDVCYRCGCNLEYDGDWACVDGQEHVWVQEFKLPTGWYPIASSTQASINRLLEREAEALRAELLGIPLDRVDALISVGLLPDGFSEQLQNLADTFVDILTELPDTQAEDRRRSREDLKRKRRELRRRKGRL